jgi:hypothetical protein
LRASVCDERDHPRAQSSYSLFVHQVRPGTAQASACPAGSPIRRRGGPFHKMKLVGLGMTVAAEGRALRRRSTMTRDVFPHRTANRAFLAPPMAYPRQGELDYPLFPLCFA